MYLYEAVPRVRYSFAYRMNRFTSQFCGDTSTNVSIKYFTNAEMLGGERGRKPYRRFVRYVYHRKLKTTSFQPLYITNSGVDSICGFSRQKVYNPNFTLLCEQPNQLANIISNGVPYDWVPDIDSVVDQAVDDVYKPPSMLNFLAEMKEIPELIMQGMKLLRKLNLPLNTSAKEIRRILSNPRRLADVLTDGVLTTNLGIMPTFSELLQIFDSVNNGMKEYLDAVKMIERQGGFRVATGKESDINFVHQWPTGQYTINGKRKLTYGAYASAVVPASLRPFSLRDARAMQSAVGLNWDLQTIWNMSPFSFVVDYFVPIGEALRGARLFTQLTISDGWVSERSEGTFSGRSVSDIGYSGDGQAAMHAGDYRLYLRDRRQWDVPDGISVKEPKLFPSARQLQNLFSLGYALGLRK